MKRRLIYLLEPRSMILGGAVFYFSWVLTMWMREPPWAYHTEMFLGSVLLIAAVGLAINRVWSNLLAAVLTGQLPLAFVGEFWMLSKNAELTAFSSEHLKLWIWTISSSGLTPFLWLTASTVILVYSAVSILRGRTKDVRPAVVI